MSPNFKIATIQLHSKPSEPTENLAQAVKFIRLAAKEGAHLVVLPEYHLTSWIPEGPVFRGVAAQSKLYLDKYCTLARELQICIVPGTIMELQKAPVIGGQGVDTLINVAYFIGPDGKVLGRYEKKNLWHPERPYLTSSKHDPHVAFDTPLGKVGLLICWDLSFPEAFRELIAQGAKLFIIPAFWLLTDTNDSSQEAFPMSEKVFLESTITSRAFENTSAVVWVNAAGPKGTHFSSQYAGLSRVAVPFVGAIEGGKNFDGDGQVAKYASKDTGEEVMSIVDLDMGILDEAERSYKIREDILGTDWHYTFRKGDGWEEKTN